MHEKRMEIANCAQIEVRGQSFVTFDVAMQGHVISTIDAPLLSGRILWSHAAIHGYCDFDPRERTELEAELGRILLGDNAADNGERDERPGSRH
ncbi:hypothetical protein SAMN05880561_103133 [Rhizobium sp. RU33A]|uniref:hypothetical protein n=1 Tax=Rhizobium sp. RU33A TaxID=1907413 RepID=UPI000956A38E|nr:hypothetical protein [Rhizobium sp. RU33A]SIQ47836.1 hypothetical protein SAMN05880561_103133 [Rhizobium sp. RU33A]